MENRFKPGDIVQHFKREMLSDEERAANKYLYEIVGVATHSETREPMMVYRPLYDDGGMYVRPLEMFLSEVDREKYPDVKQKYRFDKTERGVRGKDTPPENMHLTLAFIGEYDDPERVKEVVESIEIRPFEMTLKGIGAFRDLWWVGTENSAPLMAISRRLRRALAEADIPFDKKKFSPHITIIRRANGTLSREAADEIAASAITDQGGVSMTVDHISLMRSDRGKYGMIYTEL